MILSQHIEIEYDITRIETESLTSTKQWNTLIVFRRTWSISVHSWKKVGYHFAISWGGIPEIRIDEWIKFMFSFTDQVIFGNSRIIFLLKKFWLTRLPTVKLEKRRLVRTNASWHFQPIVTLGQVQQNLMSRKYYLSQMWLLSSMWGRKK